MSVAIVVGNPKPRSRTYEAAAIVAEHLSGAAPDLSIDLADLGAGLLDWSDPKVAESVDAVQASDLVLDSEYAASAELDAWLAASRPQVQATLRR